MTSKTWRCEARGCVQIQMLKSSLSQVSWRFLITDFWMYVRPPVRGGFVTQRWPLSRHAVSLWCHFYSHSGVLLTLSNLLGVRVCLCAWECVCFLCCVYIVCSCGHVCIFNQAFVQAGALLVQYLSANRQIVIFSWHSGEGENILST